MTHALVSVAAELKRHVLELMLQAHALVSVAEAHALVSVAAELKRGIS